ncbi:hypothetical protein CDV36_014999 [Fusarium kuroshium]|uniref:NB-ARC domain-containing protein n=1 Tax=Fusarium kuroshium TaxID=2010991 RepID=A0A3M2REV7_9HYPO|nr:hypothetical protein CDV36_014999 [Fusarium kuroshium]
MASRSIRRQDLGLKVFYDPQDVDEIEVDVVAIHGIGALPSNTWTHPKTKVNWLEEKSMLPAALPRSRIMAFGYDSLWYGDTGTKKSIEGVARKMLNSLKQARENCPHRPIIFIGHCFGGLVLQKAHSWTHLSKSVVGMVFLGTPHYGIANSSGLTTQGHIYQAISKMSRVVEDNALRNMVHDDDVLRETVDSFLVRINTLNPKPTLFSFYEEKPTRVGLLAGLDIDPEFVINQTSGVLSGHDSEGLELDHFAMNKFEDSQDNHFQCVARELKQIAKKIPEMEEKLPVKVSIPVQRQDMPNLGAPMAKEINFASRGGIIPTLTKLFKKQQIVALYGASGTGKTHVAVEFAHTYPAHFPGANVYWVNANSIGELEASFTRIAERLNLRLEDRASGNIVRAVGDHLKKQTYLMVLDGLDSESSIPAIAFGSANPISGLFPYTERADFLITSRSKTVARQLVRGKPKYSIEISALDREDASILLLGKVSKDENKLKDVDKISEVLQGSAGGLAMAWAYLDKTGKDTRNRKAYLAHLAARPQAQTGVCVPVELFERGQVQEYLPVLEQHGLVEPSKDRRLFTVTPLFRKCAQESVFHDAAQRTDVETLTVGVVRKRFHTDKDVLLPCALAALKLKHVSISGKRDQAVLMFSIAQYHMDRGDFEKSLPVLRTCRAAREADANLPNKSALIEETVKAIKQAEAGLSQTQERVATMQSTSAVVRSSDVDRVDDAYTRCIQMAQGKYNEGLAMVKQGKFAEGEALYHDAIEVLRSQINHANLDQAPMALYLKILSCLASMYCLQQRFEDAAKIFGIILPEQVAILGVNHADTLLTRNDYALVLQESGRFDAAAQELERVRSAQIRTLGADDYSSLRTECNLAWNYKLEGKIEEARKLCEDVLKRQKKVLEKGHPDIEATQKMLNELLREAE